MSISLSLLPWIEVVTDSDSPAHLEDKGQWLITYVWTPYIVWSTVSLHISIDEATSPQSIYNHSWGTSTQSTQINCWRNIYSYEINMEGQDTTTHNGGCIKPTQKPNVDVYNKCRCLQQMQMPTTDVDAYDKRRCHQRWMSTTNVDTYIKCGCLQHLWMPTINVDIYNKCRCLQQM